MSCLPPYSTSAARLLCDEHVSESSPSASSKVLLLLGGSVPGIMLLPVRDCFFYQPWVSVPPALTTSWVTYAQSWESSTAQATYAIRPISMSYSNSPVSRLLYSDYGFNGLATSFVPGSYCVSLWISLALRPTWLSYSIVPLWIFPAQAFRGRLSFRHCNYHYQCALNVAAHGLYTSHWSCANCHRLYLPFP